MVIFAVLIANGGTGPCARALGPATSAVRSANADASEMRNSCRDVNRTSCLSAAVEAAFFGAATVHYASDPRAMAVPDCTTRACAGQDTPLVDGPDSLNSSARPTLEQMKAVEEMRRTLREVRLRLQLRAAASAGPPSAGQASRSSSELCKRERRLAGWTGLEPAASAVTGQRSNQLNYHPFWGFQISDFRSRIEGCHHSSSEHDHQSVCHTATWWAVRDSNP